MPAVRTALRPDGRLACRWSHCYLQRSPASRRVWTPGAAPACAHRLPRCWQATSRTGPRSGPARTADAELFHAELEGAPSQPEALRGVALSRDLPAAGREDRAD